MRGDMKNNYIGGDSHSHCFSHTHEMAGDPSAALRTQVRQTSVILFHQYPK